jgi:ribosome biogenesis GTPase
MGLDDDFNPRRLERFLALVQGDDVLPVVVLTKADVATPTDEALDARLDALRGRIPGHVDVVAVNATHAVRGVRIAELPRPADRRWCCSARRRRQVDAHEHAAGRRCPGYRRRAGQRRPRQAHDDGAVVASVARGACVIDTPGLRTLRPDGDEATLAASFADIDALAAQCRFRDCRHVHEPGCAVRDGVDADRLRNYHKLLREMRRDTLTALDRQRQVAEWKVRGRIAKERMRAKRGESGT